MRGELLVLLSERSPKSIYTEGKRIKGGVAAKNEEHGQGKLDEPHKAVHRRVKLLNIFNKQQSLNSMEHRG